MSASSQFRESGVNSRKLREEAIALPVEVAAQLIAPGGASVVFEKLRRLSGISAPVWRIQMDNV